MTLTTYFLLMQAARLIPLGIGLKRWNKSDPSYRPFVVLLALGFINESINFFLIKTHKSNVVPFNIFEIVECIGILYQLYCWGFWKNRPMYFYLLASGSFFFWAIEKILFRQLFDFPSSFRVAYAFVIVLIILNKIIYIANENTNVFRNSKFIICTGLIIFFIYQIFLEGALYANLTLETNSRNIIIRLLGYMDILTNLIYAWAMFVVPGKSGFLLEEKT